MKNVFARSEGFTSAKDIPHSSASLSAIKVFPQPGGPRNSALELEIPDGIPYKEIEHIDSIAKGMCVNYFDRLSTTEDEFQDKNVIRDLKTYAFDRNEILF